MVYLFLTDGCEMVEALTPIDILRRADVPVTTVSITGKVTVKSSSQVEITADTIFEDCDFSDLQTLILPGGPGVPSLLEHEKLCELVVKSYNDKKLICAICAAPKLLTHVGIKAKTAVYPTMSSEVFQYCKDPVCIDGDILTANAMASSLDFSLEILRKIKGKKVAEEVAERVVR